MRSLQSNGVGRGGRGEKEEEEKFFRPGDGRRGWKKTETNNLPYGI